MLRIDLSVDFNGVVLFEPDRLVSHFGGHVVDGADLHRRFVTSADGDDVLADGIVVPVLGINDGFYTVVVRLASETSPVAPPLVVVDNGEFPLEVGPAGSVVLADLAVLREWEAETGWNRIAIAPGHYAVTIRGFRRIEHGEVEECGYEFVLAPRASLPTLTAALDRDMQVLCLPG